MGHGRDAYSVIGVSISTPGPIALAPYRKPGVAEPVPSGVSIFLTIRASAEALAAAEKAYRAGAKP